MTIIKLIWGVNFGIGYFLAQAITFTAFIWFTPSIILNDDLVNDIGIIDATFAKTLKNKFRKGEKHLFNKVWSIIVLNHFLIKNNCKI